jgi:hypothetical protein
MAISYKMTDTYAQTQEWVVYVVPDP